MKKKVKKIVLLLFLSLCCILSSLLNSNSHNVYATSVNYTVNDTNISTNGKTYTNVLDDLQKDTNFDISKYPTDINDYSLQVIQVAESNDKELFVYVYQPCANNDLLTATYINMSLSDNTAISSENKLYSLSFVNSNDVFYKYRVKNFSIQNSSVRYYNITSIYRKWYKQYDKETDAINDNDISQVSFPVGYLFTLRTNDNGEIEFSSNKLDVITITSKWVGFIRYTNGSSILRAQTDGFFVAFDTDKQIDELMSASISFIHRTYHIVTGTGILDPGSLSTTQITYGSDVSESKELSADVTEEIKVGYIFKSKYTWKQIESKDTFVNSKEYKLNKLAGDNLEDKKWVLRFWTSKYKNYNDMVGSVAVKNHEEGDVVKDVTILRLTFKTNGVVYNLGCVDNMQTSSTTPAGYGISLLDRIKAYIQMIFGMIALILILMVLSPFLPIIFSILGVIIKVILKVVLYVLKLPFKLLKKIFNKGSDKS